MARQRNEPMAMADFPGSAGFESARGAHGRVGSDLDLYRVVACIRRRGHGRPRVLASLCRTYHARSPKGVAHPCDWALHTGFPLSATVTLTFVLASGSSLPACWS
jgi:hypothetical protein